MPHLPGTMNLEDAANIGELLGGLAIVVTLIFGIRQIIEFKKTKEQEATRELANLLASPMYQSGISVLVNRLSREFTLEDIGALDRNEKDALNYLVITTNSIGLLTFERHLSFHAVSMFFGPVNRLMGERFRVLVGCLQQNATQQGFEEKGTEVLDWSVWLLDRMDELPPPEGRAHIVHKDWTP